MKIYLSGPMRGIPYFNFPRFMAETTKLRADGHEVFCPAESDLQEYGPSVCASLTGNLADIKNINFSLREALFRDCEYICKTAEAIMLLPGWEKSKGATAERALGIALGLQIIELPA
jgi:hypothetical protein